MDRSFLSQPEVIAASRNFVCVRLTTYENKDENEFLKSFHVTGSGEVENTLFTILAADGKRTLARAARSARQTFGDSITMALTMNRISRDYPAKPLSEGRPELPVVSNLRLAIDVAACDNRPLVVLRGGELEERLTSLAWSDRYLGRFIYVKIADAKELAGVEGVNTTSSVLVLQPDPFGQKAKVLQQVDAPAAQEVLAKCLDQGASLFQADSKTFANHVREGKLTGAFWETVLPVTDPMERQARERGRR